MIIVPNSHYITYTIFFNPFIPKTDNNFIFLLQPHQKYNITQYEELSSFIAYSDERPYLTIFYKFSLPHFPSHILLRDLENVLFELGSERVEWL